MNKRIPIILGLLLAAFAVWLQITSIESVQHIIGRLENLAYDIQVRARLFTHKSQFKTSVAIVDIDDKSLNKIGRWPWSRNEMAKLITALQQDGAVVIALDVIFPEKENNIADLVWNQIKVDNLLNPATESLLKKIQPAFDYDAEFATSLSRSDIVLGISFTPENQHNGAIGTPILQLTTAEQKQLGIVVAPGFIGNVPQLQAAAKNSGFINVFPDEDGVIRRVPTLIRYQDSLYPSLALEAASLYLLSNIKLQIASYGDSSRLEGIKIGDHLIPTDSKGQVIAPFQGKSYTFPYYSAADVMDKKIPQGVLGGKIVFIGTSAVGLGDLKATAIQNVFPGVEVQATVADGILKDMFSYKPAWSLGAEIFITIALGILLAVLFPFLGPRSLSMLIVGVPMALIFGNNALWSRTGLIISILVPIALTIILAILNMVYGYLFETRRRERLKDMFGQYVPAKHIDEMLRSKGTYGLLGEDRDMTVLFADIRNFTTISEPLTASQLKEILNEFFTPMTEIIFNYRGTIDKYIGDLIMAFWGAPLKDRRHAQHAIEAALDMQKKVEELKAVFAAKNWPDINIGIGLNSGVMSVGDMGSTFRRNYTVLGDAVNLGSRVESLTKYYDAKIMVAENTQHNQKNFIFRELDRVRVKGKKNGIRIYEVLCRVREATPELNNELAKHHAALELYYQQQWDAAYGLFSELSQTHTASKLYPLYLHRITEFKETPPPSDWDGVYVHASK